MQIIINFEELQENIQLATATCRGCGFVFYAPRQTLVNVIAKNGELACPACCKVHKIQEVRLRGPVRVLHLSPAVHEKTLVTDLKELTEEEKELQALRSAGEKVKKPGTMPGEEITFSNPARNRTVLNGDVPASEGEEVVWTEDLEGENAFDVL